MIIAMLHESALYTPEFCILIPYINIPETIMWVAMITLIVDILRLLRRNAGLPEELTHKAPLQGMPPPPPRASGPPPGSRARRRSRPGSPSSTWLQKKKPSKAASTATELPKHRGP